MVNPYFVLWKSNQDNQYYWVFKGSNHETLCVSEGYITKLNALNSINIVSKFASMAKINDRT